MDWDIKGSDIHQIKEIESIPFAKKWKQTDVYIKIGEVVIKIIFTLILLVWTEILITNRMPWIFLDYANYLVHEIGHFLFMFFGEFLSILGGTILQVAVPLLIIIYFYRQKKIYSAAFSLFWLGDVLVNVSMYIGDARSRVLPLASLTSVTYSHGNTQMHDWYRILSMLHILNQDKILAGMVFIIAVLCLAVAIGLCVMNIGSVLRWIKITRKSLNSELKNMNSELANPSKNL